VRPAVEDRSGALESFCNGAVLVESPESVPHTDVISVTLLDAGEKTNETRKALLSLFFDENSERLLLAHAGWHRATAECYRFSFSHGSIPATVISDVVTWARRPVPACP